MVWKRRFVSDVLRISILVVLFAGSLPAATITGTVRAKPVEQSEQDVKGGKYDSRKYKFLERIDYGALKDFVVSVEEVSGSYQAPQTPLQVVTQKDGTFHPHVLPILVGTTVEWPNLDEIYHNVFSMSEAKSFDLGLYKDPVRKRVLFDKPGRVDVFCSIHTKMNCIILVLPNPFFAATGPDGKYRIENVPAGKYKLKAWQERLPAAVQEITVPETGEIQVDFMMGITGLPRY